MAWAVLILGNQQLGQERQSRRHPEVDPQLLDSPGSSTCLGLCQSATWVRTTPLVGWCSWAQLAAV